MKLSTFGTKFTTHSGILSLMDDLGNALATDDEMIMMGGGNPAHIPEVEDVFRARLQRILDSQNEFTRLVGTYDPPQGEKEFIHELAAFLNRQFGWQLSERNIALTNGSQAGFFMLFNMFAGDFDDGSHKRIQLPIAPEYIGYADAGLSENFFTASRPTIDQTGPHEFKYRVDFANLTINESTGALCASRPTNPSGNVLTDEEVSHLDSLARSHDIPLIIDGAYGTPFPNLIYTSAKPQWNSNTILCLTLSKLGLPAARTGIVIANEEITKALTGINAIMNLAPNSFGSLLALDMVRDDSIVDISNSLIRPFYKEKAEYAVQCLHRHMDNELPWQVHKPEGAMFLWLWFKDLPISSLELYERLKRRHVLVVSGHYFFPGIDDWRHKHECIRMTFTRDNATVEKGIAIIAEEVRKAYAQ
ncbi:valine--pyruvate aminotransferase [Endozoicomonas montiporae]|uniref:Valine--pyruvate aminotransferase n=2 Tax=Endozoicomonas montiporae TaxID=1027273 RepID=A0A081N545_9GAMM|nr:valine--pyruvate transaminase [Endozoicomonas montiporae]AMO57554.1 valine--pyruvate transaminase [Endozoicomonas montiporae CL-33]KEQ13568.1 valine--pyruvate aminotransferase [Endozoicomonas montiporae]